MTQLFHRLRIVHPQLPLSTSRSYSSSISQLSTSPTRILSSTSPPQSSTTLPRKPISRLTNSQKYQRKHFCTQNQNQLSSTTKMSDEDYANFLDKANKDVSGSKSSSSGGDNKKSSQGNNNKKVKLQTSSEPLPESLHNVDQHIFVSDADEPFESVNLALEKGQDDIDADTLSSLLNTSITKINQGDFDPKGSYDAVVTLVKKAAGNQNNSNKVTFWQGQRGGARVEYYVLTVLEAGGGKRVVGVRATSVES